MDGAYQADGRISVFRRFFIIPAFLSQNLQSEAAAAGFFSSCTRAPSGNAARHTAAKDMDLPGGVLFDVRSGCISVAGRSTDTEDRRAPVEREDPFLWYFAGGHRCLCKHTDQQTTSNRFESWPLTRRVCGKIYLVRHKTRRHNHSNRSCPYPHGLLFEHSWYSI